jgi:hypothetical protein
MSLSLVAGIVTLIHIRWNLDFFHDMLCVKGDGMILFFNSKSKISFSHLCLYKNYFIYASHSFLAAQK